MPWIIYNIIKNDKCQSGRVGGGDGASAGQAVSRHFVCIISFSIQIALHGGWHKFYLLKRNCSSENVSDLLREVKAEMNQPIGLTLMNTVLPQCFATLE